MYVTVMTFVLMLDQRQFIVCV